MKYYVQDGEAPQWVEKPHWPQYKRMFDLMLELKAIPQAMVPARSIQEADIVIWTGGADISPSLYGEAAIQQTTGVNPRRDRNDIAAWHMSHGKFRLGICRGAQLLNVLSGGGLWQHVDGHHKEHKIHAYFFEDYSKVSDEFRATRSSSELMVSSTHHQGMKCGPEGISLAHAIVDDYSRAVLGQRKYFGPAYRGGVGMAQHITVKEENAWDNDLMDHEIIWYPKTRSLCVQGHPEYYTASNSFINLVGEYIMELTTCAA
jgi:gamma-glutamyl-gamma-aminobutyrate hydrolase PuuD